MTSNLSHSSINGSMIRRGLAAEAAAVVGASAGAAVAAVGARPAANAAAATDTAINAAAEAGDIPTGICWEELAVADVLVVASLCGAWLQIAAAAAEHVAAKASRRPEEYSTRQTSLHDLMRHY